MRLINTKTLFVESFDDSQIPKCPYAILSHMWGSEEVLFHEVQDRQADIEGKAGWRKMAKFCAIARKHGFDYAWIDTCCIDKRYSAELSEAINSMYQYYYNSTVCFIYLEDVRIYTEDSDNMVTAVQKTRDQIIASVCASRWHTRGWTLQEFVTPRKRRYFATDWSEIEDGTDLLDALAKCTGIDETLLENRDLLRTFCVGERMKWASKRQTTRPEDVVYSLMGLFNVHMPVMYGEGTEMAFKKFQREIMQSSFDMTIFAWRAEYESSGLLARSPADFANVPPMGLWAPWNLAPFSTTNVGLSIRANITDTQQILDKTKQHHQTYKKPSSDAILLAALQCDVQTPTGQWQIPMVYLEPVKGASFFINGKHLQAYRRIRCAEWVTVPSKQLVGCPFEDVLVLQDEQYDLVRQATQQHYSRREPRHSGFGKDMNGHIREEGQAVRG
ncbi:HET-domain-containing protein [Rostrohypoxylon terebratum]|nr:HET-domain-containing protein [Rostrohypoxylon terebratum]